MKFGFRACCRILEVVYEHGIYVGVSNKVFTHKCQRIGDCMEFFILSFHAFVCCVLRGWKGIWQLKEWNLGSIIKTCSKRERKKFIHICRDDDDVFYKLCKQSWCEENYIVVVQSWCLSKLFDVCLMGWKKVDIFFPVLLLKRVCKLMFFNHFFQIKLLINYLGLNEIVLSI